MPTNFGSTPTSTTTLGTNQFPVSSGFVPNTASGNLTSIQLGPSSTDSNGYVSAPVAIYVADGSDVTQGTSSDSAGVNTVIGQLKQIRLNTASVTIGGGTVAASQSGSWTVSGSGNFNNASVGTTGSAVPASASYIGGNKAGNLVGVSLDSSGNLNVNVAAGGASGGTSSSFGSAFPATGTAIGASDGTNMQGLLVESSSNKNLRVGIYSGANGVTVTGSNALKVDNSAVTQPVSGTITANIGTTNGVALDTSVNGVLVSQGSTTSGEKGPLIQGAVTTSAPTYTTAQTSPISLTTAGAVRVDGSAVTQPISGTVTANQGGTWTVQPGNTANTTAWKVDGSAVTQPVSGTITANAGTNLNTSALALDTSVNGILLAQGSTTSGQSGPILQGAVTTNAPSYTTAKTDPLSLDTSGLLRVSIKDTPSNTNNFNVNLAASAATVTVTGTVSITANSAVNIAQVAGGNTSNAGQTGAMQVGGAVATNTVVSSATNPLLMAGSDYGGTPKVQTLKVDSSGNGQVAVTNTPSVAQSGTWTVQPGNTANTTPWLTQPVTGTSGGSTPYHNVVSSGTNGTNVKASAGQVYDGVISNTSSSAVYFRFYDTSGTPTVGTTASKRTMQVPGNGTLPFSWPDGLAFTSGIAWGITTLIADADTTAISSSVSIDFGYK